MQTFMRKHRKALLVVIILTIGLPMLFFGLPEFWRESGGAEGRVLVTVGEVPVYEEQFIQALQQRAAMQAQGGTPPSIEQLDAMGVSTEVLQEVIDQALFTHEIQQRDFAINEEFADERLREDSMFLNAEGNFDADAYNEWVQGMMDRKVNWNAIRESVQEGVTRQVFVTAISAPAGRVLDSEIEQELLDNSTKIKMRYAAIEPPVEVTEEEIQQHYAENQEQYRKPDQRVAEYVAVPLTPDVPEIAASLVEQARAGADFAALANEHSGIKTGDGGLLGYMTAAEQEMSHRAPIASLAPGAVSDPIPGPGGYFIYKHEEERVNEATGQFEINARQIFLPAQLTEEQRAAKTQAAEDLLAKAKESGDLAAAAQAAGFAVQQSAPFDNTASELPGIPAPDTRTFTSGLAAIPQGDFAPVLNGVENLYVARVSEVQEGTVPPLEEVREQVRAGVVAKKKMTPEFQESARQYLDRIKAQATSLDDIGTKFPELSVEIKESSEFTKKDYLFQEEVYLSIPEVYDAIAHKEPGAFAGPFIDFRGTGYFVELAQVTPPTEEQKAAWPDEEKALRQRYTMMAENDLLQDYQLDMRQRLMLEVPIEINQERLDTILRRNQTPELPVTTSESAAPSPEDTEADASAIEAEAPAVADAPATEAQEN